MKSPTERRRGLARRVVAEARARAPLRGALLAGSAGRGDADEWSDVDLLLYSDELPPPGTLEAIAAAVRGVAPRAKGPAAVEGFAPIEFLLDDVRVEASYLTVARIEWHLDRLTEAEDVPAQAGAVGMLEGLVLHDDGTIEAWRERLRTYPEALRRALIESYWRDLFPLWREHEKLAARDAELWRAEMLVDGALRLLGILAALNRVYYSRFELKRMRRLTSSFKLAPPALPERLESLLRLPPADAAAELRRLASETRAIVLRELPGFELRPT